MMVIFMFYFIFGIIIGLILIASSIYLLVKNRSNIISNITYLICGIGYIISGIIGFILDKEYEYIVILILMGLSIICILTYYIFNKKTNPNIR
jgi:hypothetical protein